MELHPAFRSARLRSQVVVALFGLHIALVLFVLGAQADIRSVLRSEPVEFSPLLTQLDQLQAKVETFNAFFFIPAAITFLMWLHRSFSNLPALGSTREHISPGQRATPGAAVGAWFIPIANFVLPYRAVRHLWLESQPRPEDEPRQDQAPALLGVWWGLFIARNLATRFIGVDRHGSDTVQAWIERTELLTIPHMLDLAAAVACIMVVRRIERRQAEQHHDILLRAPQPIPTDQLR
jgi:hypothetical protein